MAVNASDTIVSGVVRSVNEKGLKLEGWDTWCNVSKFAIGVVLPERGAAVTCTLDKAGFLRAVELADGSAVPPVRGASDAPAAPSTRDRTITRLAVLKAAAEFGAARPNLKSGHILAIAETWERWINRADDAEQTTYELTDAF